MLKTVLTFFFFAVKTPEDVLHRYRALLKTYAKTRSLGNSCQRHDVDRNTIALTAVIAEVLIAVGEEKERMPKFTGQTLKQFAKECKEFVDNEPGLMENIKKMKEKGELLPLTYKT